MKVTLVSTDQQEHELPAQALSHFKVFRKLAKDLGPDQEMRYDVNINGALLQVFVQLATAHSGDEPVPKNWNQLPPRECTEGDVALMGALTGMQLIELMRTASQLGSQLLLNCVARRFGDATQDLTPLQIQDFVGVRIEIGEREREHLRQIYPAGLGD